MTSLRRRGGSGDGGGGDSGGGGGRPSSRCGAVRWGVSGSGQMRLQQRQRESLTPQQLREWYTSRSGGGGSSGSHSATVPLGVPDGGLTYLQWRPRETLTPQQLREWYVQRGASRSSARCPYFIRTGASESGTPPGTAPADALHTFTLDTGASRCFFHDKTTLTPLPAPVPVRLADPSGGPIVARSFTVLPCPAVPSGSLSCLHLPSFSTNLVSIAALQDAMVTTTTPGGQRVSISPDSSLAPPSGSPIPASPSWHALSSSCLWPPQVSASPAALAYPALPSLRRGAAEHRSSLFLVPPDDCSPADSPHGLRLQLRERFGQDLPLLRLHSDRGGEFSSTLLRDFCHGEGILQSFMLSDSPQQNGIAERRIGLVIDAAAPHFLWPFAVRHAAHQLNLWPRVSLLETSPTLRWTGEVGDALVFRVWGSRAFVHDMSADKLSPRAIPCVFLGFVPDAPGWQFYHPTSRRVFPS
ncbi:unnamed protein product [Closterium sp. NIES-54]